MDIKTEYGSFLTLGYGPIPVRGKRPLPSEWQKQALERAPMRSLVGYGRDWRPDDATGLGIVLGSPAGDGNVVVAVDIDLTDWDEVEEVMGALPPSKMKKKGAKGMTLFYRCPTDLANPRVYKGMVDFLGIGRQTIMPPSIHPKTGKPYVWVGCNGAIPPMKLPLLSEDDIVQMEEILAGLGWDRRYTNDQSREHIRVVSSDGEMTEGSLQWLNRQALDNIPSWVGDLDLTRGEWCGARYRAVNTMRSSTTGKDVRIRKLNLSIHPTGIKDFGTDQTWSPYDLVRDYLGLDEDAAYVWLAERVDPKYREKQDITALLESGRRKASAEVRLPEPEPETKVSRNMGPLPAAAFDTAPGFIGQCANELLALSPGMPKTVALLTAISTMSAITSRRYLGRSMSGLQLTTYVCAMSGSGNGKDMAVEFPKLLLGKCVELGDERCRVYDYGEPQDRLDLKKEGPRIPDREVSIDAMWSLLAHGDMTGDSAFIGAHWRCACPWIVMDEFGDVFASISKPKHNGVAISTLLRRYYSKKVADFPKQYAINDTTGERLRALRNQPLRNPAPTLLGLTTPDQMYNALDDHMNEDGTINRFIIAHEDGPQKTAEEIQNTLFGEARRIDVSEDLARRAIDIFTYKANNKEAEGAYGFLGYVNEVDDRIDVFRDPVYIWVDFHKETHEAIAKYKMSIEGASDDSEDEESAARNTSVMRVAENMMRLSCLAAIADMDGKSDPVVRTRHVQWAMTVMDAVRWNLQSLVSDHIASKMVKQGTKSEERITRNANKVIDAWQSGEALPDKVKVFDGGWINVYGLLKLSGPKKYRDLDRETLKQMQLQGAVEMSKVHGPECVRFMEMFD